jgi:hypothetical protein
MSYEGWSNRLVWRNIPPSTYYLPADIAIPHFKYCIVVK